MPTLIRDGQRVAYATLGTGPDAVLLAHNLMSQRGSFAGVAARLASGSAAGRRVIAVDLRGHGESGGAPRSFTTDDLADDLLAVLDAERVGRAVLVGTSLGATAAASLALARPDRVRGLVLMSATPYAASRRDALKFGALAAVIRVLGPRPVLAPILAQLLGASYRAREPVGVATTAAQIRTTARGDLARAVDCWRSRPALLDRLAALAMPTWVVHGDEDAACPRAYAEVLAAAVPGAELHIVSGAGHSVQLERADAVAGLLAEFCGRLL